LARIALHADAVNYAAPSRPLWSLDKHVNTIPGHRPFDVQHRLGHRSQKIGDLSVGYMVKVVTAQSTAEHDANSVARSGQAHHLPVCPCRWISGARRLSVRPNWTLAICAYPAAKCIDSPIAREGRPVTSTNPRQVAAGTLLRPALGAIKRRVADAAHRGVVLGVHRERRALRRCDVSSRTCTSRWTPAHANSRTGGCGGPSRLGRAERAERCPSRRTNRCGGSSRISAPRFARGVSPASRGRPVATRSPWPPVSPTPSAHPCSSGYCAAVGAPGLQPR